MIGKEGINLGFEVVRTIEFAGLWSAGKLWDGISSRVIGGPDVSIDDVAA
jgi:hypothetical protein